MKGQTHCGLNEHISLIRVQIIITITASVLQVEFKIDWHSIGICMLASGMNTFATVWYLLVQKRAL